MSSSLKKNIFSSAGQVITQTIVLLVLYRYLLDSIGIEKLGVWSIVLATVSAARVGEFGIAGSVTKFVANHRAKGDNNAAAEALQTAVVSIGFMLGFVLILAYQGLLWLIPQVLPANGVEDGVVILPYGLVSLWFTAVSSVFMSGLDGCLRSDLRAVIMIFGSITFLLFSLIGVQYYGLVGLAMAQVAQGVILTVLGWFFVRRTMPSLPMLPVRWVFARFREMLSYGVNLQINAVVMILFEPITKVLLGHYGDLAAAGYFEMAQRMVMKVRALIVESNKVIVPVFASMDTRKHDTRNLYISNVRYLFFLITPMFAFLLALTPAISEVWLGSYQSQFVIMVIGLAMAWYMNSLMAPAYFAYLGQGKLRWITLGHIIMGCANIIAGLVMGKYFGWQGVVIAFIGAMILGSIIPFLTYHYEYHLKLTQILSFHDVLMFAVCFGAAVIFLVSYWALYNDYGSLVLRVVLTMSSMGVVTLVSVWLHPLSRQLLILLKGRSSLASE